MNAFYTFPQESLFRDAGHSVHAYVSLIKIDCCFHIRKHLAILDSNISTESILQQCMETTLMLISETQ